MHLLFVSKIFALWEMQKAVTAYPQATALFARWEHPAGSRWWRLYARRGPRNLHNCNCITAGAPHTSSIPKPRPSARQIHGLTGRLPGPNRNIIIYAGHLIRLVGRDIVIGIETHYGLGGLGIEFRGGGFPRLPRTGLRPTQHPVQQILGLFPKGKAAEAWRWQPLAPSLKKE